MYSQDYIATVSATNNPAPGILQKRSFQPGRETIFNDIKKRKLAKGIEHIQYSFFSTSSYNSMINPASLHTPSKSPSAKTFNSSSNPQNFYSNSKETQFQDHRQRFKARPIPKSLYKPDFLLRSSEKPLTSPQDFPLTTQSPHTCQPTFVQNDNFKARPMPDFSTPFTPQHFFTPTKPKDFNFSSVSRTISSEKSPTKYIPQNYPMSTPPHHSQTGFCTPRPAMQFSTPCRSNMSSSGYNFNYSAKDFQQRSGNSCREFEPTVPMDIELHSTRRAEEREIFEEKLREQERRKEALARIEEEGRQMAEMQEVRLIRKQAEFKAKPMPKFKGRVIEWGQGSTRDHSMDTQDMMDIE